MVGYCELVDLNLWLRRFETLKGLMVYSSDFAHIIVHRILVGGRFDVLFGERDLSGRFEIET